MRLRSFPLSFRSVNVLRLARRALCVCAFGAAIAATLPAEASVSRQGTEVYEEKLSGAGVHSGRMSWFGQYGYGRYSDGLHRHVWRDGGDNGINASGLPQMVPGIALMDRRTLGHWFEVELNGRVFLVRQVDIGPHPRTGRKIDINAPLSDMAGFSPRNFPTDRIARWRHVASPQQMIALREQRKPKLKQLALLDTWDMGMSDQPRLALDLLSPKLEADPPHLSRASAKTAPWLAAAPKTVDLLKSARHWSSMDRKALLELSSLTSPPTLALGGPLSEDTDFRAAPEVEDVARRSMGERALPAPYAAPGPVPSTEARAKSARPRVHVGSRVSKKYHPDSSFEDQFMKPLARLFGLGW